MSEVGGAYVVSRSPVPVREAPLEAASRGAIEIGAAIRRHIGRRRVLTALNARMYAAMAQRSVTGTWAE